MEIHRQGQLELEKVLSRPLTAHLATASPHGPRHSPVWFLWEEGALWIIANRSYDSFPSRIEQEPACAIGMVDFDPTTGRLHHVGFRGRGEVVPFDGERAKRKLRRYLGPDESRWDPEVFSLDPQTKPLVFVRIVPQSAVVRDQSYRIG